MGAELASTNVIDLFCYMAALMKLCQRFHYDQIGMKLLVLGCGEISKRKLSPFLATVAIIHLC